MKDFIERVRKAYNDDFYIVDEPLFFQSFVVVLYLVVQIVKALYCIVAAITVPVWIAPYIIYTCVRNRSRE